MPPIRADARARPSRSRPDQPAPGQASGEPGIIRGDAGDPQSDALASPGAHRQQYRGFDDGVHPQSDGSRRARRHLGRSHHPAGRQERRSSAHACRPRCKSAPDGAALCLLFTAWGVLVPFTLAVPAAAYVALALSVLAFRQPTAEGGGVEDSRPAYAVGSCRSGSSWRRSSPRNPIRWLNLLPNAVLSVDWGRLPTALSPASHSFLPAAPYNTQFLSYIGGLMWPDYPAAGNVADQCPAAAGNRPALRPRPFSCRVSPPMRFCPGEPLPAAWFSRPC